MSQVVSFENYRPPARFDSDPWTEARVDEAAASTGPWSTIDTIALSPLDSDPASPQLRSFTTENASDTPALWYRVVFLDAEADQSQPTSPVQNQEVQPGVASTRDYVTAEELKQTLTLSGTTFADYDIDRAIAAAGEAVNIYCGRDFGRDTSTDTIRFYRPQSASLILVDDLVSVTSLLTDQDGDMDYERSWEEDLEYVLEPLNAIADNRPYTKIQLNTFRASAGFPFWIPRSVKVTGKFGWPALPSAVPQAALLLASRLVKRSREAPFGVQMAGLDVGSAVRIARTDPDVANLLGDYVRERIV